MDDPALSPPSAWDEPQVTAVLELLLAELAAGTTPDRPLIIGIDGPSGAGKSTSARHLAAGLDARLAPAACARLDADPAGRHDHGSRIAGADALVRIVAMDEIYPGWEGLEAATSILAEQVLRPLTEGTPASYPRWDWLHHRPSRRRAEVPPAQVVIVEGVGSCARRCAPYLDLQVWLDAPETVRFERAMARDGDTYRPHWQRWAAQEREHFCAERTAERADLRCGTAPGLC